MCYMTEQHEGGTLDSTPSTVKNKKRCLIPLKPPKSSIDVTPLQSIKS
jgi:hypothetical protein